MEMPGISGAVRATAPPRFYLLAKPSGSTCNLDCTYCFFLSKEALYPDDRQRMSEATLEHYIRQLLESHRTPTVTVAWQGGEPTLMRLEFFKRSVEFVRQYRRPGQRVEYTFLTNGVRGPRRGRQARSQRPVPLRWRSQVQALPRQHQRGAAERCDVRGQREAFARS
jgi:hypothetical protein